MTGHGNHYGVDLADHGVDEHPLRCESAAGVTATEQAMGADP
ncbi:MULTISPECIES: hypothetical protein [Haloarcula]|uniref:Uncharacterized protein n=2 Tax=Haloarcula sebkhae TaxID=932660 RepID=A0A830F830_9EURY|nr:MULTISPECIES: hypothetical protein [Haloarcula]GGK85254.1 hypothetical protein GCM10009067_41750 [Haloarcula sebkhae]